MRVAALKVLDDDPRGSFFKVAEIDAALKYGDEIVTLSLPMGSAMTVHAVLSKALHEDAGAFGPLGCAHLITARPVLVRGIRETLARVRESETA